MFYFIFTLLLYVLDSLIVFTKGERNLYDLNFLRNDKSLGERKTYEPEPNFINFGLVLLEILCLYEVQLGLYTGRWIITKETVLAQTYRFNFFCSFYILHCVELNVFNK